MIGESALHDSDFVDLIVEAASDKALLFDLVADICNYTYDAGMHEVSYRLEEALDALLQHMAAPVPAAAPVSAPSFRSRRAAAPASVSLFRMSYAPMVRAYQS